MKYFSETTWEAWIPIPEQFNTVREKLTNIDLKTQEEVMKRNLHQAHELDYVKKNSDGTTSVGSYMPTREDCSSWVEWRSQNLTPGAIRCVMVAIPEPGDPEYQEPN